MNTFSDFTNSSVHSILSIGLDIDFLLHHVSDSIFTRFDYQNWELDTSFSTIVKHNFVKVVRTELWDVYRGSDDWDDIIPITTEEYENLPQYFKDNVKVETRTRYYYAIDRKRCTAFRDMCVNIASAFNNAVSDLN